MLTGLAFIFLVVFSLYVGYKGSANFDWSVHFNQFSSPHYTLGLVYRQFEGVTEDESLVNIDIFTMGFIFIEVESLFTNSRKIFALNIAYCTERY